MKPTIFSFVAAAVLLLSTTNFKVLAEPVRGDDENNTNTNTNFSLTAEDNIKCSSHTVEERVFRTPNNSPLTLDQCYQLCYNTEGCEYFSLGTDSLESIEDKHIGVCIGCSADAKHKRENGFKTYSIDTPRDVWPVSPSECLKYGDKFTMRNGCDYDSFLDGIEVFLQEHFWRCPNQDPETVLVSVFGNDPIQARETIDSICSNEWDNVPTSTFEDIDGQFTSAFMEEYINGGTFLNLETGTLQGTDVGNNIDDFRSNEATNTVLDAIPSLESCDYNSIMCCFGRDRQPNDGNGNCAEPLDSECVHADPADNTNLCYIDQLASPSPSPTFTDPYTFPNKVEGPVHCHGLAWDEDENSVMSRLRFNNLFYVSMFDHMYTRGYVEKMVDTDTIGMCGCVEDMPSVSRADCTQIDTTQEFTVSYSGDGVQNFVVAKIGDMDVEFNACQGINPSTGKRKSNDLGSYVYRLNQEGKLSDEKMNGVYQTLYGYQKPNNNQNEEGCKDAYRTKFNEEYPDDVGGLKCPHKSPARLFRSPNGDPISLEECEQLCYETQFCEYFSLATNAHNDFGVCILCESGEPLDTDSKFVTYQMTSRQVFPTESPTEQDDRFNAIAQSTKCPSGKTRLFKKKDKVHTRDECYDLCYNTEGCRYFSLGEGRDHKHKGMCMGCTADAVGGANDSGFTFFEMEILPPTQSPTEQDDRFNVIAQNRKCPFDKTTRLFRNNDKVHTRDECYDLCYNTEGCAYFSLGEGNKHKGLCMGCTADAVGGAKDRGFTFFEMGT